MPKQLAHILKGRLAGTFQQMEADDLKDAAESGWAEPIGGKPTRPMRGPHKDSDGYFDRRAKERDKALGVGQYSNRMLQSGGPSEAPPSKPEPPATPIIDPAPVVAEDGEEKQPAKRGRPRKS